VNTNSLTLFLSLGGEGGVRDTTKIPVCNTHLKRQGKPIMAKMRGADIVAEYLVKEKVPYLFGLCGHGDIGFLDAFYDRKDKIKAMTVRHEQAAGHMADAYFRVAHKPVATFTSCGQVRPTCPRPLPRR